MKTGSSVLLIEDDRDWVEIYRDTLAALSQITCRVANSLPEALAVLRQHQFDLVISDGFWKSRPQEDANEASLHHLLAFLQERSPATKVIVVTGLSQHDSLQEAPLFARTAGFIEKKSFSKHAFLALVEKELGAQNGQEQHGQFKAALAENKNAVGEDEISSLESLLHAFLHHNGNYIGAAQVAAQNLYETLNRNSAPEAQEALRELSKVNKNLERIRSSHERLRNVVGRYPPRLAKIDLNRLIQEVLLKPEYSETQRIELALDEALPLMQGDDELLRHMIDELVSNAVDAALKTKGKIVIRTSPEKDRGAIKLAVADEGPGVAREIEPHLFELNCSNKPHALGLGLFLVKKCVDFHHGAVSCRSRAGEGTVFEVCFPFLEGEFYESQNHHH